ncbi:hypothetical protein Acsp06_51690 [Actinomycetospora sp. NBRC 106375]|uniref:hypothetical protein n=1 Tax=Actinomycetospora sp. NBRC 106375 TaxID=3032207 RepID=UPI0024A54004|nr:hypothetical protein [Actinomycetospora sp. NBRC 106375]GLZ48984.1 hypothetical protein Acsp06_51690 [Actinomycetospora sp. NBRC 106375]
MSAPGHPPALTLRAVDTRLVLVPMRRPLQTSAGLLAATPTAHWLEYVDWAAPVLREPLDVSTGAAIPPDRPGTGIAWDEDAVARYLVT